MGRRRKRKRRRRPLRHSLALLCHASSFTAPSRHTAATLDLLHLNSHLICRLRGSRSTSTLSHGASTSGVSQEPQFAGQCHAHQAQTFPTWSFFWSARCLRTEVSMSKQFPWLPAASQKSPRKAPAWQGRVGGRSGLTWDHSAPARLQFPRGMNSPFKPTAPSKGIQTLGSESVTPGCPKGTPLCLAVPHCHLPEGTRL